MTEFCFKYSQCDHKSRNGDRFISSMTILTAFCPQKINSVKRDKTFNKIKPQNFSTKRYGYIEPAHAEQHTKTRNTPRNKANYKQAHKHFKFTIRKCKLFN